MDNLPVRALAIGFAAAAVVAATTHQLVYILVTAAGWANIEVWSMRPIPPFGVPAILNQMFWGGLWGALFAVVHGRIPGGAMWLKGLLYGLMILVVSNWLLLPLIKGWIFGVPNQALFAGGNIGRMLVGVLILGSFGLVLGVLYGWLAGRTRKA